PRVGLEGRDGEPSHRSGDAEGHRIQRAARAAERVVRLPEGKVQLHAAWTVGKATGPLRRTQSGHGQVEAHVGRELEGLREPDLPRPAVHLTGESLEIDARRDEGGLPAEELPGLADGEVDHRGLELEVEVADPEGGVVEER